MSLSWVILPLAAEPKRKTSRTPDLIAKKSANVVSIFEIVYIPDHVSPSLEAILLVQSCRLNRF